MKRTISLFLILAVVLSCAVFFAGCSDEKSKEYPVTIGDVTVTKEPESIVVLNDALADVISYSDFDYKMVGRAITCDQDFLRIVPSVGTPDNPAVDTIVQKGADLVIADSTLPQKVRDKLTSEGINVVVLDPATDTESLKALYSTLGTLLGGSVTGKAKGEKAYNDLFEMLGQFKSATTGVGKTAAYLYLDANGQLCTLIKGSLEQKLFGYNGAINVLSNQEAPAVDDTQLRLGQPTCIFYDSDAVLDYLRSDEKLINLSALRNNKVLQIPLRSFSRTGTTCEQAIYQMVDFLNRQDEPATADEATPDEYGDYE